MLNNGGNYACEINSEASTMPSTSTVTVAVISGKFICMLQAGWQAGRRNTAGFRNFENPLQVKLFGFLLCL